MAEQNESIIIDVQIDTAKVQRELSQSIAKVAALKKEQQGLTKEIIAGNDADGTKAARLAEVQKEIEQYNRQTKAQTAALQASSIETVSNTQSLDAQRQALNTLQKAYAQLSGESKEAADRQGGLRDQIKKLSDSVKAQEEAIGDTRRNVGNYAESVVNAFSSMGDGAKKIINPIQNVTAGFKALSATPAIAILGLLATLINKVVEHLGENEKALNKASEALSIFKGVGVMVQKVLDELADGIAWLATKLGKLAERFGLVTEEMKEQKKIAEEQISITQKQRQMIKDEADAELEVAELRNKVAQKDKYSNEERLAFLQRAIAIEERVSKQRQDIAQQEYDLIKRKNAQSENSAKANEEEAQAYAKLQKAKTDYLNTTIKLQSQAAHLSQEITAQMAAEGNAAAELAATIDNFLQNSIKDIQGTAIELQEVEDEVEEIMIQPLDATQQKIAELMKQGMDFATAQKIVAAQVQAQWAGAASKITGALSNAFNTAADLLGEYAEESEAAAAAQKGFAMAGILANQAQAIAAGVRAISEGVASAAGLPPPANIASIASIIAEITGILTSTMAGITQAKQLLSGSKFAEGGIVGGSSYTGDNITARVNSGEMILNRDQQTRLFEIANNPTSGVNYEAMAAAVAQAVSELPAPIMVYSEFKQFETDVATYKEITKI